MRRDGKAAGLLTTAEAAARLGVRPETLYAYVSRGLIESHRAPGSRESRFASSEVERLAARSRSGGRAGALEIVIDTELTLIDPAGRLFYRGRDVTAMCGEASFEDVAEWLFTGRWNRACPWQPRPEVAGLGRDAALLPPPAARPVDRLRTVVAALAATDPLRHDRRPDAVTAAGRSLVAAMVDSLPDAPGGRAAGRSRGRAGGGANAGAGAGGPVQLAPGPRAAPGSGGPARHPPPIPALRLPDGTVRRQTLAARLWPKLSAHPCEPAALLALNAAMVLLADHELAAATLAARVAASTWADPYLVVLAGLGALGGALHGGASEEVVRLFAGAQERGAATALGEQLRRGDNVPGFGHKVYTGPDPRAVALLPLVRAAWPRSRTIDAAAELQEIMEGRGGPPPNVDFALACLSRGGEMIPGAGEAIFAIARCAGFVAHAMEEYPHALRFRPRAAYTGERPERRP